MSQKSSNWYNRQIPLHDDKRRRLIFANAAEHVSIMKKKIRRLTRNLFGSLVQRYEFGYQIWEEDHGTGLGIHAEKRPPTLDLRVLAKRPYYFL